MAATVQHGDFSQKLESESFFGLVATTAGGEHRFDFTLVFEEAILVIGPSLVLLCASPLRIGYLLRRRQKVLKNKRMLLKLATYGIFIALQITLLVLWSLVHGSSAAKRFSLAASALGIINVLCLVVVSYMEHNRSVRPSTIINVYLLFSVAFDGVQCRTLWRIDGNPALAAVLSVLLAVKIAILAMEMLCKRDILMPSWTSMCPESTSGIIPRAFFWWLNEFMIRGFSATLSLRSLWEPDKELRSHRLLDRMKHSQYGQNATGKNALFRSVLHCLRWDLAKCAFPRLCLVAFKFSQPFFIKRMVKYVIDTQDSPSRSEGYGLIGAAGLIYTGTAIASGFYQHNVFRTMTMIRGLLVSVIFNDALQLEAGSAVASSAQTLVTTDVDRICGAFESVHEIWANVVELGIAIWLLERETGVGCLGPAAVVIICSVATGQVARLTGPATKNWNAAIEARVSLTSSIVASIRESKMLGIAGTWVDAIQLLRVKELDFSKKSRTLMMWMNVLGNTPSKIAPVATFGIALWASQTGKEGRLSTSTAFTSLTIMSLIVAPLSALMYAVPGFMASLGCFERIQVFLSEANCVHSGKSRNSFPSQGSTLAEQGAIELSPTKHSVPDAKTVFTCRANFSKRKDEPPLLRGIDIQIKSCSFTVVTGKVGSGKTLLLRAILGELYHDGFVKPLQTAIAHCAQTVWVTNTTIRQNILGYSKLDETWYKTVVSACALQSDFAELPNGDLTMAGSKGTSLSGGQKQCISLARAVYSRLPVMVIDDVLSGLDWSTRQHVWHQVFGSNGLLRQLGSAVIFATHSLRQIEDADDIIVLGERGRIAFQGKFKEITNDGKLAAFFHHSPEEARDFGADHNAEDLQGSGPDEELRREQTADGGDLTASNGSGDLSLYGYYLQSIGWTYGIPLMVAIFAHAILGVLPDIWLKIWTDANERNDYVDIGSYYGIYVLIAFLSLAVLGLDTWFMFVRVIPKSGQRLHLTLLRSVMRAPWSFFGTTSTGDLMNRFSKDMTLVDRDLPSNFWQCVGALFSTIATAGLVVQGASYFGALLPVMLMFLYVLQKFYLRTSRQMRSLDLQASAPLYAHLLETLDGLATIQAFGWKTKTAQESRRLLDQAQKPHYLMYCIQRWLALVLDLFVAISGVILVTFAVTLPQSTSAGSVALALVNLIALSQLLTHVISSWTTLETSLGAISRLKTFENDTPSEVVTNDPIDPPDEWPAHGRLQIQRLSASYSTAAEGRALLQDVNLDIHPGRKVAVCGRTGSGKSSLILTMFRLLDITSGSVEIDGIDICRVRPDVLRQRLIAVPQEAVIFPGSLRQNVMMTSGRPRCSPKTDEQIIATLQRVTLWDEISLRGGLDTDITNLALSHGQKQLLGLARAILSKESSAILLLDEAMSAVDEHTEEVMTKIIQTEFAHHIVVSVVHKLHTVINFDVVVLLEQGHPVEVGKTTDLLAMQKGRFRTLFDMQV